MKVLVLSSYAATFLFYREDMMREMKNCGHDVIAAAPESKEEWAHKFKEKGFKYASITGIDRNGKNPFQDFKGILSIVRVIKKVKPDRIFAFQAKPVIYGAIAAKICGVEEFYAMMSGLGSILRDENKKSITKKLLIFEYRVAYRFCKKIFFQNRDDFQLMYDAKAVKRKQVQFINGTGVNLDKFAPQAINNDHTFLFIGRLLRDKGIFEYLEAAKQVKALYPNAKIQIVGGFDSNPTSIKEEDMKKYVDHGDVEYLGETDDVRPYLIDCTTFVLPSYHEGTPKSVIEAMAVGRPVITTNAPGCRETVVDEYNGYLIPVKDVEALVEKMIWMLEHHNEAEIMGQNSLKLCKKKFDVRKVNHIILTTMKLK